MVDFSGAIRKTLETRTEDIKQRMHDYSANATYRTSESVDFIVNELNGQIIALDSLESAQEGTPPKRKGGGITLSEANLWIQAKGLELNFASVAKKINDKGSFFYRNLDEPRDLYTTPTKDKNLNAELRNDVAAESVNIFLSDLRTVNKT